ncbi:MAG: hypothetical protein HKL80_04165 [Acidimicrobiales bacterium]|nr:hypothetical protein [Acidimicrobiales bacterium]
MYEESDLGKASVFKLLFPELRASIRPPYWFFGGIGANLTLALLAIAWTAFTHKTFPRPGLLGVFISGWLLADVTTTNQLGNDPERASYLIRSGMLPSSLLKLRNLMLFSIIAPVAIAATIIGESIAKTNHHLLSDLIIALLPFCSGLALGNLTSALAPYKQITLKARLKNRRSWIPWMIKGSLPYVLSSILIPVILFPAYFAGLLRPHHVAKITAVTGVVVISWSIFLGVIGSSVAYRIADSRASKYMNSIWNEN